MCYSYIFPRCSVEVVCQKFERMISIYFFDLFLEMTDLGTVTMLQGFPFGNIWVFPNILVPQNGWFIMKNPIKMYDLVGPPLFWKHPFVAFSQHKKNSRMVLFDGCSLQNLASTWTSWWRMTPLYAWPETSERICLSIFGWFLGGMSRMSYP